MQRQKRRVKPCAFDLQVLPISVVSSSWLRSGCPGLAGPPGNPALSEVPGLPGARLPQKGLRLLQGFLNALLDFSGGLLGVLPELGHCLPQLFRVTGL